MSRQNYDDTTENTVNLKDEHTTCVTEEECGGNSTREGTIRGGQ